MLAGLGYLWQGHRGRALAPLLRDLRPRLCLHRPEEAAAASKSLLPPAVSGGLCFWTACAPLNRKARWEVTTRTRHDYISAEMGRCAMWALQSSETVCCSVRCAPHPSARRGVAHVNISSSLHQTSAHCLPEQMSCTDSLYEVRTSTSAVFAFPTGCARQ